MVDKIPDGMISLQELQARNPGVQLIRDPSYVSIPFPQQQRTEVPSKIPEQPVSREYWEKYKNPLLLVASFAVGFAGLQLAKNDAPDAAQSSTVSEQKPGDSVVGQSKPDHGNDNSQSSSGEPEPEPKSEPIPEFLPAATPCKRIAIAVVDIAVPTSWKIRIDPMKAKPERTKKNDFVSVFRGDVGIVSCLTDTSAVAKSPESNTDNKSVTYTVDMAKMSYLSKSSKVVSGVQSFEDSAIMYKLQKLDKSANPNTVNALKQSIAENVPTVNLLLMEEFKQNLANYDPQIKELAMQVAAKYLVAQAAVQCIDQDRITFNATNTTGQIPVTAPSSAPIERGSKFKFYSDETRVNIELIPVERKVQLEKDPSCQS